MASYSTTDYRYPNEQIILAGTLLLVLIIIAVTATATVCGSLLFVIIAIVIAYAVTRSHHDDLVRAAHPVTTQTAPELADLITEARQRLQTESVNVFVVPSNTLNAYTFGLTQPKGVVIYSGLLRVMDAAELQFIIGHELGHVRLGHTWLNSLVGGMAGIPSPFGAALLLQFAFLWWNRACEYSADRAGLLACSRPDKALSALAKIGGRATTSDEVMEAVGELVSTHPRVANRIKELQRYIASDEYRRLQAQLNQNVKE